MTRTAHTDDEAPRLVLADLLMQRDDARGELIRLEHELATTDLDDANRDARMARIESLVSATRSSSDRPHALPTSLAFAPARLDRQSPGPLVPGDPGGSGPYQARW